MIKYIEFVSQRLTHALARDKFSLAGYSLTFVSDDQKNKHTEIN